MNNELLEQLNNKTVLITGASGLIGAALARRLMSENVENGRDIRLLLHGRDIEKLHRKFDDYSSNLANYLVGDIRDEIAFSGEIDFIVHCASETSSKVFVERPDIVSNTAIDGTRNMLALAAEKGVRSFVYLSSMEVYGTPKMPIKITEDYPLADNLEGARAAYPLSKIMSERMCIEAFNENNVPAKIVRLAQTFGPGVEYNDGRVFAEFARCAIEKTDIVLKTKGETERNYLYLDDAVDAILTVLLCGENGEAYNATNEDTYCSIYEMAKLVADDICNGQISVTIKEDDINKYGYAPVLKMNLSSEKLRKLGWMPKVELREMFVRTIDELKKQ